MALSGDNEASFTLNPTSGTTTIAAGGEDRTTYTIQPKADLEAGVYKATITVTYNSGAEATADVTFTVNKATIEIASATVKSEGYDNMTTAEVTAITFSDQNEKTLTLNANDYTVSAMFNDENAGADKTVTVIVTLSNGIANNYTSSVITDSTTGTIMKATPTPDAPTELTAMEGQTLEEVALPSSNWAWVDGSQSVGNAGTNSFNATYTPDDTDNYETVTVSVSITVTAVEPTEPTEPTGPTTDPSYYNLYFVESEGVTFTATGNVTKVEEGSSFNFSVEVSESYDASTLVVEYRKGLDAVGKRPYRPPAGITVLGMYLRHLCPCHG